MSTTNDIKVSAAEVQEAVQSVMNTKNLERQALIMSLVDDVIQDKLIGMIEDIVDTDERVREIVTQSVIKLMPARVEDYMSTATIQIS